MAGQSDAARAPIASGNRGHLQLILLRGDLAKLLGTARVVRYLMQTRPEVLPEFQTIAEMDAVVPAKAEQTAGRPNGDPDPDQARGPRETPDCGPDRARR